MPRIPVDSPEYVDFDDIKVAKIDTYLGKHNCFLRVLCEKAGVRRTYLQNALNHRSSNKRNRILKEVWKNLEIVFKEDEAGSR